MVLRGELHRQAGKGVADLDLGTFRPFTFFGEVDDLILGEDHLDQVLGVGEFEPPAVERLLPLGAGVQAVAGGVAQGDVFEEILASGEEVGGCGHGMLAV